MAIKKYHLCGRYVLKQSGHMDKENIYDPKVLGNNYMLLPDVACLKESLKCVRKVCTGAL